MKCKSLFYIMIILLSAGNHGFSADFIEDQGYLRNVQVIGERFIYTDNYFSAIYSYENRQVRTLTDTPGSGLYYSIAPDKKTIGYKAIDALGRQRPALLNIENGEIRYLYEATVHIGQPSFTDNGSVAFTVVNRLIVSDGREYDLGVYSNIAPISPDGRYVCYNDDDDNLWLMDLDNLEKSVISESGGGYYYPQWSADSRNILYIGFNGKIWIYDLETETNRNIATGHEPRWSPDGNQVVFYQKEIEIFELINSDIFIINRDGNNLRRLTDSGDRFEMDPAFSADGTQIIYHTYGQKEIHLGSLNQTKSSISAEKTMKVTIADRKELTNKYSSVFHIKGESEGLPVPYLHQVYDVPDWFWGYYACAPTTAAMLLAYHNILPKWPVTCASPYRHTSLWGRYICERYFYREQDYNYSSSPAGHTSGKGGYGYMWGTGGSPNSRMANYYEKHGMNTDQDWEQTSWLKAVNNINSIKSLHHVCLADQFRASGFGKRDRRWEKDTDL
ncbi:MAG TPA: hypothetical protein ENN20_11600 [Candidatus Marinimicrobia bacterium]|nr:hypothetical protein [Candidatus Neomarinimicrobiota bacterium]